MEGPLQEGAPRIEEAPNTHRKTPTVKQDPSLNCRVLHIARPPKHCRTPHIMRPPLALHNTNLNCKSLSCTASIPLIAHPHPPPRHCQTPLHPSVPPGLSAMPQGCGEKGDGCCGLLPSLSHPSALCQAPVRLEHPGPGELNSLSKSRRRNRGTPAQGGILRPFLREWVVSVAVHVRPRSGDTYRRADLEMGRVQPEEGCLCCPGVLPTAPWGRGHFLCL